MVQNQVIYNPKGKAGEYAKYAVNLYSGCIHGCKYCFAPEFVFKSREEFSKTSSPRKDILKNLESDCRKVKVDDNVLLCFTSDPYQPNGNNILTRNALEILKRHKIPFTILTKGGMRAARDFDLYGEKDCFASTLTFISDEKTKEQEPNAALFDDRLQAIQEAKEKGIKTWVSLEPVLDPVETFKIIRDTHEWIDLYKVGKANYVKTDIDWTKFVHEVISLFKELEKDFYIKKDLMNYYGKSDTKV